MRTLLNFLRLQLPLWLIFMMMTSTFILGSGGGMLLLYAVTPATNCPESNDVCAQFGVFWQVWDLARNNFVDANAADPQRMIEGAINGMLDTLDDRGHTRFMSASEAQRWQESLTGEFEGIGAYLNVREDGQAVIVRPIEGSPAERAGLRAGDFILAVDGEETRGMNVDELVSRIRGPRGTIVELQILHVGETVPVDVRIQRNNIEVPSVTWSMLPEGIALVRLNSFAERSATEMQRALEQARQQGARQLVLDLRNNPGGLVNEAIGIASQFLPQDTPVLVEEDRNGQRRVTNARNGGVALDLPMVVLVNFETASSAEILSGALQDARRATIIGVPTTGTGTVLTTYTLNDGAQLLLGTSQWLTPNGRLIRQKGIAPDIEVVLPLGAQPLSPLDAAELTLDELLQGDDVQLARALEELLAVATTP